MSGGHGYYDDDDDKKDASKAKQRFEFDCPGCNANNPWPDGYKDRDEVICHYCGSSFEARFTDEGKVKFREV